MVFESRRDSVGGGGSSRVFSVVSKSQHDSGGGVVAEFFPPLSSKNDATRFSGGGGSARNFPLMGPFYIFFLSQRGGARAPCPPLNRPLDVTGMSHAPRGKTVL